MNRNAREITIFGSIYLLWVMNSSEMSRSLSSQSENRVEPVNDKVASNLYGPEITYHPRDLIALGKYRRGSPNRGVAQSVAYHILYYLLTN